MGIALLACGLSMFVAGSTPQSEQAIINLERDGALSNLRDGIPVIVQLRNRRIKLTGVSVPMKPLRASAGKLSVSISPDGTNLAIINCGKESTISVRTVNNEAFATESLWPNHKSFNDARYTNGLGGMPRFMQIVSCKSRIFVVFRIIAGHQSTGNQNTFAYGLLFVESNSSKPKLIRLWPSGGYREMFPVPCMTTLNGRAWAAVMARDNTFELFDLGSMKIVKSGLPHNFGAFVGNEAIFYESIRELSGNLADATIVNLDTFRALTKRVEHDALGPIAISMGGAIFFEWGWKPVAQFYDAATRRFYPAKFKDE